ncbi:MAG: hypothetical protein QG656_2449, partial [Candidatus Hydrogenedentes bacterium]|nr:hypothetical protein [Candidatus Hydrogenedentota bacterium]
MWNLRVSLSVLMVVGLSACPALVDWPGLGNPPVMDVVVG